MTALGWLLDSDSDPSVRWQALQDLAGAPADVVAAERARVVAEGWGARLLALRGADGQWAGGAYFPAQGAVSDVGPPMEPREVLQIPAGGRSRRSGPARGPPRRTASCNCVTSGIDPRSEQMRQTIALVRDNCRWEEGGQPYFQGEVEPCINGMTVALGAYFDQDVDGVVSRLVSGQLGDGGWNCWAESGAVVSSAATTINVLEGLLAHEQSTGGSANPSTRGGGASSICWNGGCSAGKAPARSLTRRGCSSPFRPAGTTTCSVPWNISGPPVVLRTRVWPRQSSCSGPRATRRYVAAGKHASRAGPL